MTPAPSTARPSLEAPARAPRTALLQYGFRPFFLLAAAYAALQVPTWLLVMTGTVPFATTLAPQQWHAHEMVFGFALAGIAGFYLTAVPSWTGAQPVRGWRLGLLVGLWLAARLAMWCAPMLPPLLTAAASLALLPVLALFVLPSLAASGQRRNLIFLVIPAALEAAILMVHLDVLGIVDDGARRGLQLGIDLALLLIAVIGGRIVPTFTGNALRKRGETVLPAQAPLLDRLAILSMVAVLVADLVDRSLPVGLAALAAALLNGARLSGWRSLRTLDAPLLWVLHLGYAWLAIGMALKAAAALGGLVPPSAALHALTVGAIGTMMLAVMSRAALGHTGRPLVANPITTAAYVLVSLAAVIRIGAAFTATAYVGYIEASAILWSVAFAAFLATYAPVLIRPRLDGKPG